MHCVESNVTRETCIVGNAKVDGKEGNEATKWELEIESHEGIEGCEDGGEDGELEKEEFAVAETVKEGEDVGEGGNDTVLHGVVVVGVSPAAENGRGGSHATCCCCWSFDEAGSLVEGKGSRGEGGCDGGRGNTKGVSWRAFCRGGDGSGHASGVQMMMK